MLGREAIAALRPLADQELAHGTKLRLSTGCSYPTPPQNPTGIRNGEIKRMGASPQGLFVEVGIEVPLPEPAVEALRVSLALHELDLEPLANDPEAPLIPMLSLEAPLSAARIYEILVAGFERCATHICGQDRRAVERIREASTHLLRYTYGLHSAARGVPQDVLQASLGHESLSTNPIYFRAEKARKHRAMQVAFTAPRSWDSGRVRFSSG